ncbi:outer membrane protein [Helicobacter ailurogastricus]|uniref:Putative Outer membrane protein n=1 Tax=Helicobacter ailurogastricus TaxID=1578720 RepID=A0A0K2X3Z3_9HELI|nr:outer membrane protein [Helicobacter ailurogastricus]CRF41825.1 putative Outer membrane protein [Helicobacter ailurogastricus]CRF43361.1 putative Outer membrane protein [Helicobacter ailurogastricus]CRF45035.1 putative Outer membrane protein [Helicobacter ailurogastricus]
MRKFLLGVPLAFGVMGSLAAEENGVFIGADYQIGQGRMNTNLYNTVAPNGTSYPPGTWHYNDNGVVSPNTNWQGTDISWHGKYGNGAMNGFGVLVGQKFFFKIPHAKTKWLGVRYYGFLDYGFSDLGPQLSLVGYDQNVRLSMVAYGIGADVMGNFIDRKNASVGVFGGFAIGGNAWQVNAATLHAWKAALLAADPSANLSGLPHHGNFNVWLNFGFRTNLFKHNGLELGVKLPMLVNPFFPSKSANTGGYYYSLKRDYSVYVRYLYTF